ncbi:unnamed protein product [Echinostoma caproni]|uniref:Pleckstrin homology like domain family B member 2 n=1 Tax=Echinostoma caproni TaxID=27848 RepID=A0A183A107_9TREM|nr:unnamed protein product [Echinostoma caproni]
MSDKQTDAHGPQESCPSVPQPNKPVTTPSPPPPRPEVDIFPLMKGQSNSLPLHTVSHSPSPTAGIGSAVGPSSAQKVAQLEAELRALEARPGLARPEELDRLRVEIQFQRRLADRESLRRYRQDEPAVSLVRPRTDVSPAPHSGGPQSHANHSIWEEKRSQAERELEATYVLD